MIDTWDLWLWITLGLIALVWAVTLWKDWYLRRQQRRLRDFVRGWDSRQDFAHRVAERGKCERAGLR